MLHNWSKETDGNSATVRAILFDYKKAFDLTDDRILVVIVQVETAHKNYQLDHRFPF